MSEKSDKQNINIFEDLIDELKEENLIEETIIETRQAEASAIEKNFSFVQTADVSEADAADEEAKSAAKEADFYRKRATEEVASLQMVESVFAGIERDQLKIVPTAYDDWEVKKVLHTFLRLPSTATATERSQAEFALVQATEDWYSTLAERDQRMMTAHLRRYCETSRPPLSAPALIALAKFYRNSPYSESVRSKFDLMLTRLFSQDEEDDAGQRELAFSREELILYIKELYAEWSSVPLYPTDADDAGIAQIVAGFEDFIGEAKDIALFDELLNSNYFNRLRLFKESVSENFYAPTVAAVAVELNVYLGNRYIELLEKEKQKEGVAWVENKYGWLYDHTISEATGKTLTLVELLNQRRAAPKAAEAKPAAREPRPKREVSSKPATAAPAETEAGQENSKKWILAALLAIFVAFGIYYLGSGSPATDDPSVVPVNLENSILKNYLREARITDDTLNGTVLPSWNAMTGDQRKEALRTMMSLGGEKGFRKIELLNDKSEKVGIVTNGEVYVVE